jgi:hypothetical protein
MYLCPEALNAIEKHLTDKTIVSLTRIEPPLHPPGPEKILQDFGIEPEEFNEDGLFAYLQATDSEREIKTTEGIFAPWAFYKKDFQEIGGHDPLFAPQSKEDSDIFNRFQLNGIKFIQTWEGCVYHMTCRGSRFADGAKRNPDGQVFMKNRETDEWLKQNLRSTRNFIRKWGHYVKHDGYLKPIIPFKYNIGFIIKNCNQEILHAFEPWCSTIYIDTEYKKYITLEQPNTNFNLSEKILPYDNKKQNDILVEINGNKFTQQDFQIIQQLSEILDDSGEVGEFEIGNLKLIVYQIKTYEKELIKVKQ